MDKIQKIFDLWATNGRSELMEKEHSVTVLKFLNKIKFEKSFVFLDFGCGNGWVVRKIIQNKNCKKAIGIDKSKKMINLANKLKHSSKAKFIQTGLDEWKYKGKFDYVFSMESLYYVESIDDSLKKIFSLLKPNGRFFCGTDYYAENKSTTKWQKMMNVQMHLKSKKEWVTSFKNAGFNVKIHQIQNPTGNRKWKREFGTLFIIGTKPGKSSNKITT